MGLLVVHSDCCPVTTLEKVLLLVGVLLALVVVARTFYISL